LNIKGRSGLKPAMKMNPSLYNAGPMTGGVFFDADDGANAPMPIAGDLTGAPQDKKSDRKKADKILILASRTGASGYSPVFLRFDAADQTIIIVAVIVVDIRERRKVDDQVLVLEFLEIRPVIILDVVIV
jgi:hypothetical protein